MTTTTQSGTRERLLEIAERAVLAKGFGATSIDELTAEAGITKGGFFYHFRDKNELARALLQRYMEREDVVLDQVFARGRELAEDPLQAFLIGLKLMAEMMADLPGGHPGCLVANYCYQERLFDAEVRALNRKIVLLWRARFRRILDEIGELYAPREALDPDALADSISAMFEGGMILSRALGEPDILPQQILHLRSFVRVLFVAKE